MRVGSKTIQPFSSPSPAPAKNPSGRSIFERNAGFFEVEAEKLEGWAEDLKLSLEREIKDLDRQIREARRAATTALTLEEKLAGQKTIKALEAGATGPVDGGERRF